MVRIQNANRCVTMHPIDLVRFIVICGSETGLSGSSTSGLPNSAKYHRTTPAFVTGIGFALVTACIPDSSYMDPNAVISINMVAG